MKMVYMNKKIPVEKRKDDVVEVIRNDEFHLTAVLSKTINGCIRFWKKRVENPRYVPPVPAGMCSNFDDYIRSQSPIQTWVNSCLEFTEFVSDVVNSDELRIHYTQWCKSNGANSISDVNFKAWLEKHIAMNKQLPEGEESKVRRPSGFAYRGLKLKASAVAQEDRF